MKKIYIVLMHTNTIPSKVIKTVTEYRYSHVGLCLEKSCNIIYSFGRRNPHSILNAGFSVEYKDGEFFQKFNKTICKIYEVEVTDKQYKEVENIINYMRLHIDEYKYDIWGIVPRFLGIPLTLRKRYVCSYFVAHVLEKAGIYKFNKRVCLIKPKDFDNLDGFKEVYRGNYIEYRPKFVKMIKV